ncbi:MAG: hypothetical protein IRY91_03105 [Gemmatimonadaceae bacterium]|nr:hypothetical protein [Gemmatimonadaceae bacterium]
MDVYTVVLFLHLLAVVAAFVSGSMIHLGLARLRTATQVASARDAARLVAQHGPRMPLIGLALFVTGAILTQTHWTWRAPWVVLAIVGLVVLQVNGGAVIGPRLRAAGEQLARSADGPLSEAVATLLRDPVLATVAGMQGFIAAGVMFIMITKPGAVGATAELLLAMAIGVARGVPAWRAAARPAAAQADAAS